ncbi:MAG: SpoIVB peptidase S55 domain-containing protein [Bryobacteraceae bacterium]
MAALPPIFPLKDIRAGQRGVGKTVFSGNKIEDFQVEILGVLENMGPKQSVILARLSGGPLAETGVLQGMSGSPVYIDGRLAGAVALAFTFAKEPIAGIRPIEDMLPLGAPVPREERTTARLFGSDLVKAANASVMPAIQRNPGDLVNIATPVSFNGFSTSAMDHFAPQLRQLGLEPRQGVSSGGHIPPKMGDPSLLHPGDMITVQLLSGDMSIGADGTVTAIDGKRIFAFGHHFLAVGGTELPFARANVITVLPNLSASFKISSALEWMGTITEDRSTSVYGELGRRAATVPLSVTVHGARHSPFIYNMEMVNDRVLSPFILQMAVYSAMEATERTLGQGSFAVHGQIDFAGPIPPIKLNDTYSGDFNVPLQASLGISTPLAYAMGAGFHALKIQGIALTIDVSERKRVLQVDQVAVSKRDFHPGDTVELTVTLAGENGAEMLRTVKYRIPPGAPYGPLQFTVADASSSNLTEYQQLLGTAPRSAPQLIGFLNSLRPNTNAYVRVWRAEPDFQVQGMDLPNPPPSLGLALAKAQGTVAGAWLTRGSKVAELEIDTGNAVVTGSKTVQVDVKE